MVKADNVGLLSTVIVLLPMISLFFAAPVFLILRLDNPPIAQLLRGLFNGCLLAIAIAAVVGALALGLSGRLVFALGFGVIAGLAVWSRGWFVRQWDTRIGEQNAGKADAYRQLRLLHWSGMASNAIQLGLFVACIPSIVAAPV